MKKNILRWVIGVLILAGSTLLWILIAPNFSPSKGISSCGFGLRMIGNSFLAYAKQHNDILPGKPNQHTLYYWIPEVQSIFASLYPPQSANFNLYKYCAEDPNGSIGPSSFISSPELAGRSLRSLGPLNRVVLLRTRFSLNGYISFFMADGTFQGWKFDNLPADLLYNPSP